MTGDSLAQVSLVSAVEDAFKVKFNIREAVGFKNVGEMADSILEKIK